MRYPFSLVYVDATDTTHTQTLTASSTIHTMGAWVAFFSALAFDAYLIDVYVAEVGASGVDTSALLEIGADPDGGTDYTDITVVPDYLIGCVASSGEFSFGHQAQFSVYIPAGSTVAARSQSLVASDTVEVGMTVHGGTPHGEPFPQHGPVLVYGVTASTSSGVSPANALANVEGAWVELTSATTHPHRGLTVGVQASGSSIGTDDYFVDIGIGASSSEVAIAENVVVHTQGNEQLGIPVSSQRSYLRDIPEGSRLSVRAQADGNNLQSQLDVAVYGWG